MKTVIIIGAGAAGLIACGTAAKTADKVILVEQNEAAGKKLRITGKGRCNITNSAELEDIIAAYPTNGRFMYSALYAFTNEDIVNLIESMGVKTKVERGGRIFPVSDSAADVVNALKKYAFRENVECVTARAKALIIENGALRGVKTSRGSLLGDSVIVCTGGMSYPKTGSDGSGYALARQAGHTIVAPKPSLVPIVTEETWPRALTGLSLKNVAVTAFGDNGRKVYSDFGEMLFTHFGISGPIVLSMSAHLRGSDKYRIETDLKPALDEKRLDARLVRDFEKYAKKHLIHSLDDLLPKALIPIIIGLAGLEEHRVTGTLTREERGTLGRLLKHLPLTFKSFRPIEEAIITSGGVKTSEINPSDMQSKKLKGLYFAGEIIDVDGYTGGYNLQEAWSTGYLAGMSAAGE